MKNAKEILTSSEKFHISLGLERTKCALEKLNNPQKNLQFIHVAGTNGKGSTCAMLNEILCTHFKDEKIGLFTSPHLFSYRERIKINGVEISQENLDLYINKALKAGEDLTEFELLTVAAFLYFSDMGVKIVVLEVGLGGLFDSTNVIEAPLCSAITTIDFDHTARLGDTIDEIAAQKAGIIKRNSKTVVGAGNLGLKVIQDYSKKIGAKLIVADDNIEIEFKNGKNFAKIAKKSFELALLGEYQAQNLALVLKVVENLPFKISEGTIKTALKNVRWKFRLEYDKDKKLLIDGAHNPSGIKALRGFLDKNFKDEKITFIFGCLNNKDYENMLKTLVRAQDEFYFYEFNYPNALKFEQLPKSVKEFAKKSDDPQSLIQRHDSLLVVCGSLYMLGELFNPC